MKSQPNTDPKTINFTPPHKIKAVFWDIDGTLADSEPVHEKAWMRVLSEHGIKISHDDFHDLVGTTFQQKADIFCKRYKIDRQHIKDWAVKKYDYFDELVLGIELIHPSIPTILKTIKENGLAQAAVSNGNKRTVDNNIKVIGHEYFDFVLSKNDAEKGKPDPELYLLAAKKAGIDPKHCLVVEDSLTGVQAGLAAGMTTIACPYNLKAYEDNKEAYQKAHLIIETIDDLNWTKLTQ